MSDVQGFIQHRWGRYSLDEIWAMVAHEDGTVTAAQVQAWRRMAALCQDQASALEQALGQLFHRWPPHPGSSAAAFRDRLLDMIKSMRDSAAHASTMPDPLWKITNQLTMTRYDILELLQQRAATEEIERSQDATHGYNGKSGGRPEPDALPTNWREQFDQKARQIMVATETAVAQAAAQIQTPIAYSYYARADGQQPPGPGQPGQPAGAAGLSTSLGPGPWVSAHGLFANAALQTGGRQDHADPILTGSEVPAAVTAQSSGPNTGLFPTGGSSVSGTGGLILGPGVVGGLTPSAPRTVTAPPTSSTRLTASSPQGHPTQSPMVAPVSSRPTPTNASGGIRASGRRRYRKDGDEPWGGRTGVPGILEPPPEPVIHDPGPGVIGLDR